MSNPFKVGDKVKFESVRDAMLGLFESPEYNSGFDKKKLLRRSFLVERVTDDYIWLKIPNTYYKDYLWSVHYKYVKFKK